MIQAGTTPQPGRGILAFDYVAPDALLQEQPEEQLRFLVPGMYEAPADSSPGSCKRAQMRAKKRAAWAPAMTRRS